MDFQTLDEIDTKKLLEEVSSLFDDNHVFLQKDYKFIHDLSYTNSLLKKYNMKNSRIMKLHGKQCYTWHRDQSPRIHFPLITNSNCLFILEESVFRMPIGKAYYIDTRNFHTALNGNLDFDRYHIVGLTDEMV